MRRETLLDNTNKLLDNTNKLLENTKHCWKTLKVIRQHKKKTQKVIGEKAQPSVFEGLFYALNILVLAYAYAVNILLIIMLMLI